jgi:hypothetical protein
MVTDELVDNVIEVARTPSVFKVSLDGDGLRIALRDFKSPRGTQPEPKSVERRSLDHAIRAFSDSFGITPLSDGKAVWVVLRDGVAK